MQQSVQSKDSTFRGKKALVIGGSGGIGAAVARLLAKQGLSLLTIHAGHDSQKLHALTEELSAHTAVQTIIHEFKPEGFLALNDTPLAAAAAEADILCICFGPFLQKPLDGMSADEWLNIAVLDYALPGFFVSTALPAMKKNAWGRILLFGGTGTESRREFMTNAAYAGAKTGIGTLVQSIAASYAPFNITCNAVLPGFTQTEYTSAVFGSAHTLAQKMPGNKMLSAASIAEKALFLLQNPDINGALLRCDGGWSPLVSR